LRHIRQLRKSSRIKTLNYKPNTKPATDFHASPRIGNLELNP